MSRGYRVQLREAHRTVKSTDEVSIDLSILGILSEGEMQALLKGALVEEGWTERAGRLIKDFDGVEATIDEEMQTVEICTEQARTVVGRGETAKRAGERADRSAEQEKRSLDKQVTQALSAKEGQVRESVQGALQRVYVEALQKKAAQMGEVQSVDRSEKDGEIELVIKVKI